jgi:hypothetical protein
MCPRGIDVPNVIPFHGLKSRDKKGVELVDANKDDNGDETDHRNKLIIIVLN